MNIENIKEYLSTNDEFSGFEYITDSIFRFEKKAGNTSFAIYYVDTTDDLPNTKEALKTYQDQVIGKYYFNDKKSLQWSNYLYFVSSKDRSENGFNELKNLIESDRNYARKFIISEHELKEAITPPVPSGPSEHLHASIVSVWNEKLVAAGLDNVVLTDADLPTRIRLIEASSAPTSFSKKTKKNNFTSSEMPKLRNFDLINYRPFPTKRHFEFGKVNLIVGDNGVGKTSLLEAIELFYCGKNRRNPDVNFKYKLSTVYTNGESEVVDHNRLPQDFRNRNLAWYGQPEIRTNNLYQSFSQFNFLDTDAAVHLTTDNDVDIEDDLSKLLIGSDASKIWRDIERVTDAITSKLRELKPLQDQIKREQSSIEIQLNEVKGSQNESDSIANRLLQMLKILGWQSPFINNEDLAEKLIESLSEMMSFVKQSNKLNWIESPLTRNQLDIYCDIYKPLSLKAGEDIALLNSMKAEQQLLLELIKKEQLALNVIEELEKLLDSGILDFDINIKDLNKSITQLSNCLGRYSKEEPALIPETNLALSLDELYSSEISSLTKAEESLNVAKNDYERFSSLRVQATNLAEELRLIASKIIIASNKADECPLCHTEFMMGELKQRMNFGIDLQMESTGQSLLIEIEKYEQEVVKLQYSKMLLEQLQYFCNRADLTTKSTVKTIISKIISLRLSHSTLLAELSKVEDEILNLESQNISIQKIKELISTLNTLGYFLKSITKEEVLSLKKTIEDSKVKDETLEIKTKDINGLQHAVAKYLNTQETLADINSAYSKLKEQLVITEKFIEKLNQYSSQYPWGNKKTLIELELEIETIKKMAVEMQLSINKEKLAKNLQNDLLSRKSHLETQLGKINPKITRLSEAQNSLSLIQKNHSLNNAMTSSLNQNKVAIEKIFSHIHSPAEFEGLGSNWKTVVRKSDKKEAKLTQISTGQRAAFALSIFMARNAQLSIAPPVILIDDPIAYIDDLNSLSFLDYLREVSLKGNRQIFFATANDKLAALFQRKFDFLNQDFKRFDLTRNDEV